ncbi:YIP1 family protein [Coprobacter sp.]
MFRSIISNLFALVAAPGKAWQDISSKKESSTTFLNGYLYPIMGLTALSVFANLFSDQFTLERALKLMTINFVKFFVGFYIASFLIDELLQKFFEREKNPKQVQLFAGYTLSVYMLITIFLNLLIGMFSFLRFAPLYIIYVIWEGSKYYMDINENKRLLFVVLASLILLFSPDIIERFMFILMPGLIN